jgi:RNA polymerase subunit RPABC4/transcription elongation factor Spt4
VSVAPPGAPPAPGTIACPRCATAVGPDQDWCLACGSPARTRLVPTPNWRAPVVVLATVILLAGIALAIAFVALTNDTEPAAPVDSQAPPPSATTTQPPASAQPAPTQSTPTASTPTAPDTGATTGQGTSTGAGGTAGTTTGEGGTGQSSTAQGGKSGTGTTTGQGASPGEGGG